jgi:hypothetical protein
MFVPQELNDDNTIQPCIQFDTQGTSKQQQQQHPFTTNTKLKKKKSRISLVLEKTSSRESLCERETGCSSFGSSVGSASFENNYTSPTTTMNNIIEPSSYLTTVYVSIMIKETIKQITLNINTNTKILLIIDKAITEFNKEFNKEKVKLQLKDDPELFVLKPAKKNGKPKTDFPYFNEDITLNETHQEKFALCWKDNPDDFQQMFEIQTKNKNCSCFIF